MKNTHMTDSLSSDIVRYLSMQEETIAALYTAFGVALPDMQRFWQDLFVQEKAHAEVVGKLANLCDSNNVYFNVSKFNIEAIKTHIAYMQKLTKEVRSCGITPVRALSLAADIENSLLEAEYFQIIQSDRPAILAEIREIQQQTEHHKAMIRLHLDGFKTTGRQQEESMTIEEKVIQAQKEIIDKLACCEESIGELYNIYSEIVPDPDGFWKEMAEKEKAHARLLRTMHKQLDKKSIFYNIGRFSVSRIDSFLTMLRDNIAYSKENEITTEEAVNTALAIESSIMDTHFYRIVKSDAPEYRHIAERLSNDTQEHMKAVQGKLVEIKKRQ